MFTGLVECTGTVAASTPRGPSQRLALSAPLEGLVLGESIAVNGACLTVVNHAVGRFEVDVSSETLARTSLGSLRIGSKVNLERALRLGDRLGGHLVSGHVDGLARVVGVETSGEARSVTLEAPGELAPYVAAKGSVTLDGVSLTVNGVDRARFWVMMIPHTLSVTTLSDCAPGRELNLEVDLVARYVVRYLQAGGGAPDPDASLRAALERAQLL
jgi:riboflavin synthase